MMTSSNIWMLAIGLLAVIVMVVLTASARRTVALGALLVLIPFQVVETRYASSSVLIAYAMAATMLLLGGLKARMLPAIGLVLLAYLVSLTQAESYLSMHVVAIFQFASCFIVFLLAYNYARLVRSERSVMDVLLAINVLVAAYCVLQLTAGAGEAFTPFGIEQLEFNSNRDPTDPRLVGPFDNPGTTAGYFTLMTIICAVELLFAARGRRRLVQFLILANVAGIIATGNRASFLVVIASIAALLFAFRIELGPRRFVQFLLGGLAAVVIASAVITAYTGFGNMFRRLQAVTEMEGGIPTTRAGTWPLAIEKIKLDPWFGEGPHFLNEMDAAMMGIMMRTRYDDLDDVVTIFDPYPHSLYLFLLRTVGVVGLIAVVWFFVQVLFELRRSLRRTDMPEYSRALVKVGMVVTIAFLVTQVTLEFNRPSTMDYAQFVLALLGLFIGVADRPGTGGAVDGGEAATSAVAPSRNLETQVVMR
jgi:O-antigen ligase